MVEYIMEVFDMLFGWRRWNIKRGDVVLDLGSGNNPNLRADVLCDKYPFDNLERAGRKNLKLEGKPLVVADSGALPFRDKSFDYIICRHLLEHTEDPDKVLKEIMRVGKKGYIETPTEFSEMLSSHPFHLWFLNFKGDKLILKRKKRKIFNEFLRNITKSYLEPNPYFQRFCRKNLDLFLVRYEWQRKINYEILPWDQGEVEEKFDRAEVKYPARASTNNCQRERVENPGIRRVKDFIKKIILNVLKICCLSPQIDFMKILVCPLCKGELQYVNGGIICSNCQRKYPVWEGMPILLKEKSTKV